MHEWTGLIVPFAFGAALGASLVFVLFKSRLRFYKYMIEQRLADVNQRIVNVHVSPRERANVA